MNTLFLETKVMQKEEINTKNFNYHDCNYKHIEYVNLKDIKVIKEHDKNIYIVDYDQKDNYLHLVSPECINYIKKRCLAKIES